MSGRLFEFVFLDLISDFVFGVCAYMYIFVSRSLFDCRAAEFVGICAPELCSNCAARLFDFVHLSL